MAYKKKKVKSKKPKSVIKKKSSKKSHLDDLEDDIILGIDPDEEIAATITESDIGDDGEEIIEDKEVIVPDVKDTLQNLEGEETFGLSSPGDDEGVEGELQTIRSNPAPRKGWSDLKRPKFSPGDLVVLKGLSESEALNFEPYKIVCPSKDVETYSVVKSRRMPTGDIVLKGKDIKKQPKGGKPFLTYWEANNPFNIPGLKISCPSNSKK